MKYVFAATIVLVCSYANAQSYNGSIWQHRQHYKEEFVTEERSPIKGTDTGYLRFFAPDESYKITCSFMPTPDAPSFDMPTSSGKTKKFRQYGLVTFKVHDTLCSLQVFQNLGLLKDPKHSDHLFIPFTDGTTYTETYGGGRYIDLSTKDVTGNKVEIDFNKCYNPYCAFADGYNCPIPPVENRLPVTIPAGEKIWAKERH